MEGTLKTGDKQIETVSALDVSTVEPPSFLNTYAKKFWKANLKTLSDSGLLKESDLTTFSMACSAYSDFIFASDLLEKERKKPDTTNILQLQRQKNTQQKLFLEFAKSLGLTSVDRQKVRQSQSNEDNSFSEFD